MDSMTEQDVVEVLEALGRVGVDVWIDGGWGVDALVGTETRSHTDLDLAVDRALLDPARTALEDIGFRPDHAAEPSLPARLVMRDPRGRQVDIHPLVFDVGGNGWQQLSESGRAWGMYPARHLHSTGTIGGRSARCLSPELQVRFRLAHEWSERDQHDLHLLAATFDDVPVPPPLWDSSQRVGRRRQPRHEMEAEEVVRLVGGLEGSDVSVWLDGGWGIDALLGRQTRAHDDLDLVVSLADVSGLRQVLADRGYSVIGGGSPMSFELADRNGRQIDVHPVAFNDRGDGVYLMRNGAEWIYPAAGFQGRGKVLDREVRCLTPEVQMLCHEGYELDAHALHDMRALREEFRS
jgi:lincosamide nucleotidyltransferase A/C/D/E